MVSLKRTYDGVKMVQLAMTEELEKDKTYYFVLGTYYAYTYTGEFSVTITCTHDKTHIEKLYRIVQLEVIQEILSVIHVEKLWNKGTDFGTG